MHNSDFHHERSFKTRRLFAWVCVAFGLLIVIGAGAFSLQTGLIPGLSHTHGHPSFPSLPGITHTSSCTTPAHDPGDSTHTLTSGGQQRNFIVHLPPSYGDQPQPLVFNYHGYDNTAARMVKYSNMGAEADKANFIVVFPQGADAPPSWNAGVGAFGPTGSQDDVAFTRAMITYMQKNYCVDAKRIFVTGYSIGASMAYRVACTLSKQIAGLATVEGAFYHFSGGCHPSRPIPVLEIHGQADTLAPYNGDPPRTLASVQTFLNIWFDHDKCDGNVSKVIFQKGDVTGYEWPKCATGTVVQHFRISDGGHVWPGAAPFPQLGFTTHVIDANVVIWNFFSRFHL